MARPIPELAPVTTATARSSTGGPFLAVVERGRALLGEGAGGFAVVVGLAGAVVVRRFHVHALEQIAVDRPVEVLLHVAVGDPGSVGQPPGPGPDVGLERGV